MGENFPEGTSQSDPSAAPRTDEVESPETEVSPISDGDQVAGRTQHPVLEDDEGVEEEPENQQTG